MSLSDWRSFVHWVCFFAFAGVSASLHVLVLKRIFEHFILDSNIIDQDSVLFYHVLGGQEAFLISSSFLRYTHILLVLY